MTSKFVLYRILGNDLPPRHGGRQTLENLHFILENEPEFPDCEKRWVVNRVADKEREGELLAILGDRRLPFIHIPFDLKAFRDCYLDGEDLPDSANPIDLMEGRASGGNSGLALEWVLRRKNLYAINVNGARNTAIDEGVRAGATWIMPWDGACYLTETGFAGIVEAVAQRADAKLVVVPMARVDDNRLVLDPAFQPETPEEPQLIFHRTASDRFDQELRYGNRPKAELLRCLGVPGRWQGWDGTPWEHDRRLVARDKDRFVFGGWVARLGSGAADEVESAASGRWRARITGVQEHSAALDRRVARFASSGLARLGCYQQRLERPLSDNTKHAIISAADGLRASAPPSVVDKPAIAGTHRNDYVSIGRYWHSEPDGTYVRRDGQTNPAAIRGTPGSESYDRYRLQAMIEAVATLTVAHSLTGDAAYSAKAVAYVDRWFIAPETRMNPHGRFAQVRPDQIGDFNPVGTLDFRDFWPLVDALRILRRAGVLNDAREVSLRAWFLEFQQHLLNLAAPAGTRLNNVGTLHDVLAAAVAAYLNDFDRLIPLLSRTTLRIVRSIEPWGWQPAETQRPMPLHYTLFSIQALIAMATIARANGIDVWRYSGRDRRSIAMAVRFAADNRDLFADYAARAAQFDDRIVLAARLVPPDAADADALAKLRIGTVRSPEALGSDEGVPPLWAHLYGSAA